MAGDHGVDILDARDGFRERLRQAHRAAAVERHDIGHGFPRKEVGEVRHAQHREHDDGVPVRVPGTEVVQVDPILPGPHRHLVFERFLRQVLRVLALEGLAVAERRACFLRHVVPRVLLGDELDRRRELGVAARMVPVRVRVDDGRHRLVGHRVELAKNLLSPTGVLGIDEDDSAVGDERSGVTAAGGFEDVVQVVFDLLDPGDLRPLLSSTSLEPGHGDRQRAAGDDGAERADNLFPSSHM